RRPVLPSVVYCICDLLRGMREAGTIHTARGRSSAADFQPACARLSPVPGPDPFPIASSASKGQGSIRQGRALTGRQAAQARAALNGDRETARTKSFTKLVQRHVRADKKFAEALLREGI